MAGTVPHAWGTGRMDDITDDITYVGLDVHKATVCVAVARVQISEFPTGDFGSNRQAVSVETDRPFRSKAAPRCEWVLVPALANRRCVIHPILLWPAKASTLVIIIVSGDCCGRLWIVLIMWISVVSYLFD
jgi:hypothetical protein